ncbi:MAG: (5-formylfuran-3-yl)methyl phosphate synthase [Planctomycetes bacterium]|nr:(5-formylfuran-3-yl)methyl phosphate synthase [Planctomycetota bacterium]
MTDSRPQLLVSVRNAAEAMSALIGGCDILDLKEPNRGSLGMAGVDSISEILRSVESASLESRPVPVSAALGETVEWIDSQNIPELPNSLDYLKLGLSGMSRFDDWVPHWLSVRSRFEERADSRFRWIAVIYGDREQADSPEAEAVIEAAIETGCAGVLFDTFSKTGKTLLDWLDVNELKRMSERIQQSGLKLAIAGSLRPEMLPDILPIQPDIVAIRTAACRGGDRTSSIDSRRVRSFKSEMHTARDASVLR